MDKLTLGGAELTQHQRLYPQWIDRNDGDSSRCLTLFAGTYQCEEVRGHEAEDEWHLIRVPDWPDGYRSRYWKTPIAKQMEEIPAL